MKLVFKMAVRNIRRHLRGSLITMISISLGLAIVFWLQCIMAGRQQNVIDQVTRTYTGHFQIFKRGYLESKLLSDVFTLPDDHWTSVLPEGAHYAPRIHVPGLISSGEQSAPIMVEGIDPVREGEVTSMKDKVVEGTYLDPASDTECTQKQVYIGRAMATLLNVRLGNKLVLMVQTSEGALGSDLFRVKGIFDSKSPEFDKRFAYISLACAKQIASVTGIHEIAIRLPEVPENERAFMDKMKPLLPETVVVTNWRTTLPSVDSLVRFNDAVFTMISGLLLFVIILGVVNTLLMNVFQRTKEFGVMLALGTTPWKLRTIVLTEVFVMTAISALAGTVLGAVWVFHHQRNGFDLSPFIGGVSYAGGDVYLDIIIYPIFRFASFLKAFGITLCFSLVAGIYPAFRASRLNPVDTMKG